MVNYVEAALAPLKNDGQIKLYGPADFAGMRRAGRLVAECLDAVEDDRRARACRPRRSTASSTISPCDHGALPATLGYKGYMKSTCISINHVVCHGIPERQAAPRRRHRQHRRDADPRRLARQFEPHVQGRRRQARRRAADRGHLRGDDARHRRDPAGRHHRRHRLRHPGLCRARALQRRPRFLRPRRRPALPRRAQHPALRQPRRRRRC